MPFFLFSLLLGGGYYGYRSLSPETRARMLARIQELRRKHFPTVQTADRRVELRVQASRRGTPESEMRRRAPHVIELARTRRYEHRIEIEPHKEFPKAQPFVREQTPRKVVGKIEAVSLASAKDVPLRPHILISGTRPTQTAKKVGTAQSGQVGTLTPKPPIVIQITGRY